MPVLRIITKRSQNDPSSDIRLGAGSRNKDDRQWANIDGAFDHSINARFHYDPKTPHGVANVLFVVIDCRLDDNRRINVGRDILE